jgi:hypothetical protein
MRIDNNTTIETPTIALSWSFQVPHIIVSAKYENERNSYGRTIGQFVHDNGWKWQPNEGNTQDVIEHFAGLKIEDLAIDNLAYYTPPQLSTLRVAIPQEWEIIFPDDKFIINGFEVQLERVKGVLAVDVAYLDWQPFKDELDKPENATVKRSLEGVWDYVKKQYDLHNFI